MSAEETASCRWCNTPLRGKPFYMGGGAYFPLPKGGRVPVNYYGGYVCSRRCDYNACLDLERSMPGHGPGQKRVGAEATRRIEANWGGDQ